MHYFIDIVSFRLQDDHRCLNLLRRSYSTQHLIGAYVVAGYEAFVDVLRYYSYSCFSNNCFFLKIASFKMQPTRLQISATLLLLVRACQRLGARAFTSAASSKCQRYCSHELSRGTTTLGKREDIQSHSSKYIRY